MAWKASAESSALRPSRACAGVVRPLTLDGMSITVDLSDQAGASLAAEAARRGISPEQLAAEAIEARFGGETAPAGKRRLAFAAAGSSSDGRHARDADDLLAAGFGQD